jgi:hypothetical protein
MFDLYGITGLPTEAPIAGGTTQQSISGWSALGRQSSNPQYQNPFVVDARLNYSWIRGRHTFKAGYEYQSINTEIDDSIRSTAPIPMPASSASRPAERARRRPTTSRTS